MQIQQAVQHLSLKLERQNIGKEKRESVNRKPAAI